MYFPAVVVTLSLLLSGCAQPEPQKPLPATFDRLELVRVVAEINRQASATQQALQARVQALNVAGEAFLDSPTEETLTNLQARWREAHLAYASAQFGFLNQDPESRNLIFRIDAWPIQPGFIDNLPLYPESGIINDETLELSASSLIQQHGITDEEEVALGFHSIEFLIFGRPRTDFERDSGQVFIERRRLFLALVLNQLEIDTQNLLETCKYQFEAASYPEAMNILQQFLSSSLQKIRVAFRESNLLTSEDAGHSTFSASSLETVRAEVEALEGFMFGQVSMGPILKLVDSNAYANMNATFAELHQLILDGDSDEVSRANLPLLLSALTHQLDSFDRMLAHRLPAS